MGFDSAFVLNRFDDTYVQYSIQAFTASHSGSFDCQRFRETKHNFNQSPSKLYRTHLTYRRENVHIFSFNVIDTFIHLCSLLEAFETCTNDEMMRSHEDA